VRYAHLVGVMQSSGAPILLWKRDAVAAYRQVPMAASELWKCGTVGPGGILVDTRLSSPLAREWRRISSNGS
jgi:hypothetical protein